MRYLERTITGVPYAKYKSRGKLDAPREWTDAVIAQTRDLPVVEEACLLKVTFLLPPDKYPADYPYGPDLDNLLKRLLDALGETVFSGSHGGDSCVVSVEATKVRVDAPEEAGAVLQIYPVSV